MASKTINTILTLQDKMSPKLVKVTDKIGTLDKKSQRANKQLAKMCNDFSKAATKAVGKVAKLAAATAGLAGAASIKIGLAEAMDLEGYRLQLETATKSGERAAEIMKYAIDLANRTPFEGGQLVEAASKFESMGMSAEEWLTRTGDMAAATNKPIDQAVEALIDAQTGELERLKEFGITKLKITEKANEMFRDQTVVNNKGQIEDLEKFNQAIVAIMEDRFTGGMAKQATTMRGLWSTVTGVTKNALANIVGVQNDGTIKSGSLMDILKGKVQQLADTLQQWQNDGTIDRIADKAATFFTNLIGWLQKVYSFVAKYKDWIIFLGTFIVTVTGVIKVLSVLSSVLTVANAIAAIFGGTLALLPLTWIIVAIGAAVAAVALLVTHWEDAKEALKKFWKKIKEIWQKIKDLLSKPLQGFVHLFQRNHEDDEKTYEENKRIYGENAPRTTSRMFKNALGTSYWRGGTTSVNERGGEIIDLPSGSRIIPADKSKNIVNNHGGNNITININATNKSTNEILSDLVPRLKLALANI